MAALGGIGSAIGMIGSVVSAFGTIAAGAAAKRSADYQAAQLEIKAKEEKAAAQREAGEVARQKRLVQSRQQAVLAASGGGALDETALDLAGDVEREGTYRELAVRYGGDERAKGLRAQATAARMSGQAAMTGAIFDAAGGVMKGASTFFDSFGGGKPTGTGSGSYLRYG